MKFPFLFMFSFLSSQIFADNQSTKCPCEPVSFGQTYDGYTIIERPKTIYKDSNKVAREGRTILAEGGVGIYVGSGSISYFLNPDRLLTGSFLYQKDLLGGDQSKILSLGISEFISDSFVARVSLALRNGDVTVDIRDQTTSDKLNATRVNHTDYGIDAGFGQKWQLNSFSLSIEWFGFYMPVVKKIVSKTTEIEIRGLVTTIGWSL